MRTIREQASLQVSTGGGLAFPLDVHLARKRIQVPEGTVLVGCPDCHQQPGGGRMQPSRMEEYRARCHQLNFDPAEPERVVPHGAPDRVLEPLIGYHNARSLADHPECPASMRSQRALARGAIERRVCAECHPVSRRQTGNGPLWSIEEVQTMKAWMPKARFSQNHAREVAHAGR